MRVSFKVFKSGKLSWCSVKVPIKPREFPDLEEIELFLNPGSHMARDYRSSSAPVVGKMLNHTY
jgi:hypothetical protein